MGAVGVPGDAVSIEATVLTGSRSGEVAGPAIFVGLGDAVGVAGQNVSGGVAVALRGELRFSEKYETARAAGAIALVIINSDEAPFSGALGLDAAIPVVGVAGEDSQALLQAADRRATVTVQARTSIQSVDVIARSAPGATCRVVVGAHHDTVAGVPGATDNASGTAVTLELSRALAADGLDAGLCFVTFGGEESGLFGSRALVEHWERLGTLPEVMLNLDVVGTGTEAMLIGDPGLIASAEAIAPRAEVRAVGSQMPVGTASDHASFADAGVSVLLISSDDFSGIHTPLDALDEIDEPVLEGIGDLAYELIVQLLAPVALP